MVLHEMDNTDLHFNNIELTKLVASAEKIFQNIYDLVPNEQKNFITDWYWHKQEYDDTCLNDSQFDSDEDLQECSVARKKEHPSSESGCSTTVSSSDDSCFSTESGKTKDDEKNNNCPPSLVINSKLIDRMNEFRLVTDSIVSEWYQKITSDLPEVKRYLNYLENEEYKICPNIYRNTCENDNFSNCDENINPTSIVNPFQPTSTELMLLAHQLHQNRINSNFILPNNNHIDLQICRLQEIRQPLLRIRQNQTKLEKNEVKSIVEFATECKRVELTFELIDTSIEMKNQLKFGRDVSYADNNDEIDIIIANSLDLLSVNEMRFVLMMFLNNCVEMRRCSIEGDNRVKKLEDDRSALRVTLFKLYQEYNKLEKINRMFENVLKRIYEDPVRVLQRIIQQKREEVVPKTSKDNGEMSSVPSQLLSIVEQTDLPSSSQSLSTKTQESLTNLPSASKVSNSLKTRHNADGSSSAIKVTLEKTKLHFRGRKKKSITFD